MPLPWHGQERGNLQYFNRNVYSPQIYHPPHYANNGLKIGCLIRRQQWGHIHTWFISERKWVRRIGNQVIIIRQVLLQIILTIEHSLLEILRGNDRPVPDIVIHLYFIHLGTQVNVRVANLNLF